jgi:hypothetical protein
MRASKKKKRGKEGDLAYENKIKEKTLSSHAWISYFLCSLWKSKY